MNKLIEVLGKLDPSKDEHWTQDGAARLDYVSELMGAQVTRAQITEVAPKFSRANPNVVTTKKDPFAEDPNMQPHVEDKPEMLGVDPNSDNVESEASVETGAQNGPEPVAVDYEQQVEDEYKAATVAFEAAQRRLHRATQLMDDVIRARESQQQNVTFTQNVQAYLKSQTQEAHRDHMHREKLKQLMKGLENDL
ncbi:hypothetical protein [Vibrio phage vB_VpaS_CHI]|nr:hypothetical protein [Vibrio phage vB_VpaS_ALK]USL90136.1 hypothetical protein [Vibrio phage vB_VpaS_CHI]